MKIFNNVFIALIALLTVTSCDDRLEQINPNEVTVDSYYTSLSETESGITAIYSSLLNHAVLNIEVENERADMAYPGWGRNTPANTNEAAFYFHTYTNSQVEIAQKWEACYSGIWRANQVIDGLRKLEDEMSGNDEQMALWQRQMAEARFFRGWYHFNLHSSFNNGSIIIRDEAPVGESDFNKSLSPSEEVISFFREDLKYAYDNLPPSYSSNNDLGRVTAGTAAAILGNSHLFEGEYDLAKPYYQDVISNSAYGYELVRDMSLLFTGKGEFNKESIFEIVYNETQRTELTQWNELSQSNRLGRSANGGQWYPSLWIIWAYKNEVMDTQDPRNQYTRDVILGSDTIRDSTSLRIVPLRCSSMIAVTEDEHGEYYGGLTGEQMNLNPGGGQFAFYKKYGSHDLYDDEGNSPLGTGWKSGKNVTVNRLGEIYLNYAEALIQTGDIANALVLMNAVRARWGLQRLGLSDGSAADFDGVVYNAQSLMDKLMFTDKPLETSCEGMSIRWIDLRRWGVIEQRFKELSEEEYHLEDYAFVRKKEDKTVLFRGRSTVQLGPDPGTNLTLKDYEVAASNYDPQTHAYYPIPLSEILTNSALRDLRNTEQDETN